MSDIKIRKVKQSDFKDIFELNCDLGYEYPKEKTEQRIRYILENTEDVILVAELGGEIVGYIHGSSYELLYSDSLMNVLGLVIKEKVRSSGIGHLLITELENIAKEKTFMGIRLVSSYNRIHAHKFYEKHGYINRKDQKNFSKLI